VKSSDLGQTALLPLRRKSCYGYLSSLKIHRPRPGMNPRNLGPMTSTITTRPPRTTAKPINTLLYEQNAEVMIIARHTHLPGAGLALAVQCLTTVWTTGRSGFDSRQGQRIFPLASVSRPALGPTQPPVQWVPGVFSPGVKRGRGVMLTTHPHLVPRA
jgi:hypothetical protein